MPVSCKTQAHQSVSHPLQNQAIVKIAYNPEFQKLQMFDRGLTPVLDSPEHFAKTIEIEAPLGRDVVKASGLYPDVK